MQEKRDDDGHDALFSVASHYTHYFDSPRLIGVHGGEIRKAGDGNQNNPFFLFGFGAAFTLREACATQVNDTIEALCYYTIDLPPRNPGPSLSMCTA